MDTGMKIMKLIAGLLLAALAPPSWAKWRSRCRCGRAGAWWR